MTNFRFQLKNVATIVACFVVFMMFVGCDDKENQPEIKVENEAALTQTVYADQTDGTSGVTIVTAGTWTSSISESAVKSGTPPWISISPDRGGAGTHTIIISLVPNLTGADRAATITITCNGMDITITVTHRATKENGKPYVEPPVLTTAEASVITVNSATVGGNISNAGTPAYTERGVCFATTANPTVSDSTRVVVGIGTGDFTAYLTGLAANTKYYVRAYATNSNGTVYGNEVSFITDEAKEVELLLEGIYNQDGVLTTSYMYDTQGRLTVVYNNIAGRLVYEFKYSQAGEITEAFECPVSKNGNTITLCGVLTFYLNSKGLLGAFTNNTNQTDTYSYDNNGNLLECKYATGRNDIFDSYDDKKSPFYSCTTPQWVLRQTLGLNYGLVNNPLSYSMVYNNILATTGKFTYEYNAAGYPTKVIETLTNELEGIVFSVTERTFRYREK